MRSLVAAVATLRDSQKIVLVAPVGCDLAPLAPTVVSLQAQKDGHLRMNASFEDSPASGRINMGSTRSRPSTGHERHRLGAKLKH